MAYADLWQTRTSPGIALVRGLEEALLPRTLVQKAVHKLRTPIKKLNANGSLGDIKGELGIDFADETAPPSDLALRIDDLVLELCEKGPLLLLVDEAQELARSKESELVATALRTAITKHHDRVRVVFTGSSRSKLAHVFSNTDAPLYSVGAAIHDFPLLARELVEFVAEKFAASTGRTLDVAAAWQEFRGLKQQPEPFLEAVVAMMMDPTLSLATAFAAVRATLDKAENHEATWASFDALQRQLLRLFCDTPNAKPFSKMVLARLAKALGVPTVDPPAVQFALRKLSDRTVLSKSPSGVYVFESDAFERWVRTLAPSG